MALIHRYQNSKWQGLASTMNYLGVIIRPYLIRRAKDGLLTWYCHLCNHNGETRHDGVWSTTLIQRYRGHYWTRCKARLYS